MTNIIESPRSICRHSAVHLDHHVIFFGGISGLKGNPLSHLTVVSTHMGLMYNLYTEEWSEFVTPDTKEAPEPFFNAVAVNIHGTIYTFGGSDATLMAERNALWTLKRTKRGSFTWSYIKPQCKQQSPSPRAWHCGWEYEGKLWIFGGLGPSPEGYLNYSRDIVAFVGSPGLSRNNQLLCYDPNTRKWINPRCFGDVPSPRSGHASAIIKNKVWLFGGYREHDDDIFCMLTMHSLTWTQIHIQFHPPACHECTITAVADQLVLQGGRSGEGQYLGDTWILDLKSHSWKLYTSRKDHPRWCHTGCSGCNRSVIIHGGVKDPHDMNKVYNNIFHVALEPKLLQQLAMQKIYKCQAELPLEFLPVKLISRLGYL